MIITLTRTGGFTGIPLKKTIDTSKLPKEEAQKIETLIRNNLINKYTHNQIPSAPDRFSYSLSIQDEAIAQEIKLPEGSLTPTIKGLIQQLENC